MTDFQWKDKRVFLTGGSGFVGSHLAKSLILHGVNLGMYIHTKESPVSALRIYGDLREKNNDLFHFLRSFQPEIVFHLAAQPIVCNLESDELDTMRINIDGTVNILNACKNAGAMKSFVHISTDKVYGNISPITKETAPNGLGHPYNASKLVGDFIAQMYSNYYGIPTVVVRNANVYGAGDSHLDRIIPGTIHKVINGKNPIIRGDGRNTRDYLHVDDVVDAYLHAAEFPYKNKLSVVNVGGYNHSTLEVVDAILGKMGRIDLSPVFEDQWVGEIPHQHIKKDPDFDWTPKTNLSDGLDKTISWYVEKFNGTS